MVRPRTVSEWGPNAQGVRSRPDRSVSLRDPREQPVQTMGIDLEGARAYLEWSRANPRPRGYLNEPADPRTIPNAARRWLNDVLGMGDDFLDENINEGMRDELDDEAEAQVNVEGDESLLEVERHAKARDRFEEDVVSIETDRLGQQLERAADEKASTRAWEQARDDAEVGDPGWDGFPAEARGLTADEAFRQHHAMAGGEPPREGRAHPERAPAPYEPAPQAS